MSYIYSLSDPESCEIRYVGKTSRKISIRFREHIKAAKKNGRRVPVANWINSLIKRNLTPTLTVLEETVEEESAKAEQRWIQELGVRNSLLNLTAGGEGTIGLAEEPRKRISEAVRKRMTGKPGINLGRKFSAEVRARMSAAHVGKKAAVWTDEQRAKFSLMRRSLGLKWTDEQRIKTLQARSGYKATPEHRANLSASAKADWAKRRAQG